MLEKRKMRLTGAGDGGDRRVKVVGGFKVNKGPGLAPLQMQVNLRASQSRGLGGAFSMEGTERLSSECG